VGRNGRVGGKFNLGLVLGYGMITGIRFFLGLMQGCRESGTVDKFEIGTELWGECRLWN